MIQKICPKNGRPCEMTGCIGLGCMFDTSTEPTPHVPSFGWQCPKCGRGNAPWATTCPCGPAYRIVTSGGSNAIEPHAAEHSKEGT